MSGQYKLQRASREPSENLPLLRMLHPTSGRQGFNEVNSPTISPSQNYMDPRLAMMIRTQTQQAIGASGMNMNPGFSGHGMAYYYSMPYDYGIPEAYRFFLRY